MTYAGFQHDCDHVDIATATSVVERRRHLMHHLTTQHDVPEGDLAWGGASLLRLRHDRLHEATPPVVAAPQAAIPMVVHVTPSLVTVPPHPTPGFVTVEARRKGKLVARFEHRSEQQFAYEWPEWAGLTDAVWTALLHPDRTALLHPDPAVEEELGDARAEDIARQLNARIHAALGVLREFERTADRLVSTATIIAAVRRALTEGA